jgi:anti-sigma B factor antagonist
MTRSDGGAAISHILSTQADGKPSLRLIGDIDVMNITEIEGVLRRLIGEKPTVLVVDLREVTFLDSAGVRLLLQAHRWQQEAGNSLRVVPGGGMARRVLEVSGLDRILGIRGDEAAES